MDAITQVAQEHNLPLDIVGSAVTLMWRGTPAADLTVDMVESAVYAYFE